MPWQLMMVILSALAIWIGILTYFFLKLSSHYHTLTQGATHENLQTILDKILVKTEKAEKDIDQLKILCDTMRKDGALHIQKIGLIRFNPFNDTGGDQSFILALLDGNEAGVVISGLYSRSGTRWYAKKIINGKGVEHELSSEEIKAIKSANTAM